MYQTMSSNNLFKLLLVSHIVMPVGTIIDNYEYYRVINGKKVWKSSDSKRYYTWDSMHGEVEVFNGNGNHLGSIEPYTGIMKKSAVKGRYLNVR